MCPPYLDSMLTEYWVWWYNGPRSFCEILGFIQNIFHHPVERVVLWTSTQNERIGMLGVFDQVHQKDSCIIFHVSQHPSCSARTCMVWLRFLWLSKEWKIISLLKCLFFFLKARRSKRLFAAAVSWHRTSVDTQDDAQVACKSVERLQKRSWQWHWYANTKRLYGIKSVMIKRSALFYCIFVLFAHRATQIGRARYPCAYTHLT